MIFNLFGIKKKLIATSNSDVILLSDSYNTAQDAIEFNNWREETLAIPKAKSEKQVSESKYGSKIALDLQRALLEKDLEEYEEEEAENNTPAYVPPSFR